MSSSVAFDPLELTEHASLNQVVVQSGPNAIRGRQAEEICSRNALVGLAAEHGLISIRPHHVAGDLADATFSGDTEIRRAAEAVVTGFGHRLGALIATLRTTRDVATASTEHQGFLSHWFTVDRVWLAGGLLASQCGPRIAEAAAAMTVNAERPCPVVLAPRPGLAPLLGAARLASPVGDGVVLAIADLGHTSVRTALVRRRSSVVDELALVDVVDAGSHGSAEDVADSLADVLGRVVHRASKAGAAVHLTVSVAAHVVRGRPLDGQGRYGWMARGARSLVTRLSANCPLELTVQFVHDGTASAAAVGSLNSATITVGTWLGVGFVPDVASHLLDLAPELRVTRD